MASDKQKALTPKQEAFARAYVETGNASEAYRRAYDADNMKPEVVKVKACELLKNGNVAVTVEALRRSTPNATTSLWAASPTCCSRTAPLPARTISRRRLSQLLWALPSCTG